MGYATTAINEPHYHAHTYEIYRVGRRTRIAVMNGNAVFLHAGDVLAVEPHEVHTFRDSSAGYFHFVVHSPFVPSDKIVIDDPVTHPTGGESD